MTQKADDDIIIGTSIILISIFTHGISAGPEGDCYSRIVASLPGNTPERREVKEMPVRKGLPLLEMCKKDARRESGVRNRTGTDDRLWV
ncbi:hypothetical protein ACSAZL_07430 [Methanosarcina sp. T3]|uniref:hypothetical protein n=1 Tax=Methanosarcina sp. T3 TaxID=3439062 RepID=UPI003F83CCC4